nr:four-jointed box protein 1 [Pogona vitticeps]
MQRAGLAGLGSVAALWLLLLLALASLAGLWSGRIVEPGILGARFPQEARRPPGSELVELVQWSDLILFDYLTANFDRLVSNLFSLQWDPRVMHRATSNLHRAPNGGLVFLDNEAGLAHGYRLLAMWDKYNEPLLRSVCVFREATAQKVRDLHRHRNAAAELLRLYRTQEPLAELLGFLSDQQAQLLQDRIDLVHKHILHCKAKAAAGAL